MPTYSLRVLFVALSVIGVSLAALLRPTDSAAFVLGLLVSAAVLIAIAFALGTDRPARDAALAFVACTLLVLYQNDDQRTVLKSLPPFHRSLADEINARFGWAEPKGPPNTWVYWSRNNGVYFEAFDAQGNRRSLGGMSYRQARRLGIRVDLANLPPGPPVHANESALHQIVALVAALVCGLLGAFAAHAVRRAR